MRGTVEESRGISGKAERKVSFLLNTQPTFRQFSALSYRQLVVRLQYHKNCQTMGRHTLRHQELVQFDIMGKYANVHEGRRASYGKRGSYSIPSLKALLHRLLYMLFQFLLPFSRSHPTAQVPLCHTFPPSYERLPVHCPKFRFHIGRHHRGSYI